MNQNIVEIQHLSHRYSETWAVKDINFSIHRTGIFGLLGSNGAGKSTTMNIMCGVLNQTKGKVLVNGVDIRANPELAKKNIGFLPQTAPLYFDMTIDEYLTYAAHLRLVPSNQVRRAIEEVKIKCGIAHFSKRLIRNLSGGYRQRVGIAQAIIHKPLLVVLDEPTNGLDPNQILEIRKLIKEIGEDHAVAFSTHILSEVEATCNDVKMIERGELVFSGTMSDFKDYVEPESILITFSNAPALENLLTISGVTAASQIDQHRFKLNFDKTLPPPTEQIFKACLANNWSLQEMIIERATLEEIFARLSLNSDKTTSIKA